MKPHTQGVTESAICKVKIPMNLSTQKKNKSLPVELKIQ